MFGVRSKANSFYPLAVALNQEGTVLSRNHPAIRGAIMSIWISGGGLLRDTLADGAVPQAASFAQLPVQATFDGDQSVEVLYAGAAPGLVAGVMQVNVRVPADLAPRSYHMMSVQVGERRSADMQVFVQ